jgi:hypothetical protein
LFALRLMFGFVSFAELGPIAPGLTGQLLEADRLFLAVLHSVVTPSLKPGSLLLTGDQVAVGAFLAAATTAAPCFLLSAAAALALIVL